MCEFLDYIEKRGEKRGKKEGRKQNTQEIALIFDYLQSIGKVDTLGTILKSTRKFNAALKKSARLSNSYSIKEKGSNTPFH